MWYWTITYIPLGDKLRTRTIEVVGGSELEAQKYFTRYYDGKIINIRKKV